MHNKSSAQTQNTLNSTFISKIITLQSSSLFSNTSAKKDLVASLKNGSLFRNGKIEDKSDNNSTLSEELNDHWIDMVKYQQKYDQYSPKKMLEQVIDTDKQNILQTTILEKSRNNKDFAESNLINFDKVSGIQAQKKNNTIHQLSPLSNNVSENKFRNSMILLKKQKFHQNLHKQQCFIRKLNALKHNFNQKNQQNNLTKLLWPKFRYRKMQKTLKSFKNFSSLSVSMETPKCFLLNLQKHQDYGKKRKNLPKLKNCASKQLYKAYSNPLNKEEYIPDFLIKSIKI